MEKKNRNYYATIVTTGRFTVALVVPVKVTPSVGPTMVIPPPGTEIGGMTIEVVSNPRSGTVTTVGRVTVGAVIVVMPRSIVVGRPPMMLVTMELMPPTPTPTPIVVAIAVLDRVVTVNGTPPTPPPPVTVAMLLVAVTTVVVPPRTSVLIELVPGIVTTVVTPPMTVVCVTGTPTTVFVGVPTAAFPVVVNVIGISSVAVVVIVLTTWLMPGKRVVVKTPTEMDVRYSVTT